MLDEYCLARYANDTFDQMRIANILVDEYIPELIERLGHTIIERNQAWDKLHTAL